jgi:putative ABC transport system permease protein
MIKHYFKIAFRNLRKQKGLAFINILGLSVGLACFILFLLYAVNEFSFDRFHKNSKDIYRVYRWTEAMQGEKASGDVYLPMPLGPALKDDIADVESFVRMQDSWGESYIKAGNEVSRTRISYADPNFFTMFSFRLLQGNKTTVLQDIHSMVLTETMARKLFGGIDVTGQTVQVKQGDEFVPFTVSGVVADIPSNSTIQFEVLCNYNYIPTTESGRQSVNNWGRSAYFTFVQLKPGSKLAEDPNSLVSFRKKYYPDEETELRKGGYWKEKGVPVRYGLQSLQKAHTDTIIFGGSIPPVDPQTTWILLAIAFGVLLIACINFTTLSIGRSVNRAREIGIRKVVGSVRRQLVSQFMAEAMLLTIFSIGLGLALCYFLLPYFNLLSGKNLSFSFTQFPEMIWLLAGLTLVVGILSGSYPALVLSRFKPLEVLKQKIRVGGANIFTRSLVTVQFVLSIGLIASTLIILQQLKFMRNNYPGFSKENIVVVNGSDIDGKKIYPLFRQAVITAPGIAGIASAEMGLGNDEGWSRAGFDYNGKLKQVYEYFIDPDYIPLMRMQLLKGRNFERGIMGDTVTSVIINEAMVKDFGWTMENAVGQPLKGYSETKTPVVIGVVKDFHFRPFSEKVEPQLFHQYNDYAPYKYVVKLKPGNPSAALAALQKAWVSLVPDLPFNYSFLDENLDNFYKAEVRWGRIIGWAGGISVFLACLGLFGLAALAAANRTKEIGIRKVLGASLSSIVRLLSKDFLRLVIIALVIACPIAWFLMNKWLEDFSYRITISWWIFPGAGLAALLIALITVSLQAIRAAVTNPVKSLRTE